jgi:hypothetical protein
MLSHDYVASSADPEDARRQLRQLIRIVLDVVFLIKLDKLSLFNQQLCMLLIRCFMNSLDHEWIPFQGMFLKLNSYPKNSSLTLLAWIRACEILTYFPKAALSEATKLAQVVGSLELSMNYVSSKRFLQRTELSVVIPIFLREMESINDKCHSYKTLNLPLDGLKIQLELLTAMIQFSVILAVVHDDIC